jgi:integrase
MKTALKNETQPILQTEALIKSSRHAWNKGKLLGQKPPLKLKEVWEIRIRLQLSNNLRELALFNLAIDSKLRGCDLVKLKVRDVAHGDQVLKRAMVMQQKTHQPVQFEITEQTRNSVSDWIKQAKLKSDDYLFPSRIHDSPISPPGNMPVSSKNGSPASG